MAFPFKRIVQHFFNATTAKHHQVSDSVFLSLLLDDIWIFRQLLLNWCGTLTLFHFTAKNLTAGSVVVFANKYPLWTLILTLLKPPKMRCKDFEPTCSCALVFFYWVMGPCQQLQKVIAQTGNCKNDWKQKHSLISQMLSFLILDNYLVEETF